MQLFRSQPQWFDSEFSQLPILQLLTESTKCNSDLTLESNKDRFKSNKLTIRAYLVIEFRAYPVSVLLVQCISLPITGWSLTSYIPIQAHPILATTGFDATGSEPHFITGTGAAGSQFISPSYLSLPWTATWISLLLDYRLDNDCSTLTLTVSFETGLLYCTDFLSLTVESDPYFTLTTILTTTLIPQFTYQYCFTYPGLPHLNLFLTLE